MVTHEKILEKVVQCWRTSEIRLTRPGSEVGFGSFMVKVPGIAY